MSMKNGKHCLPNVNKQLIFLKDVHRTSLGNFIHCIVDKKNSNNNEYASEETMTIGEAQVTFKGTSEDEVNLAVWVSGDYSYSVSSTDAVSADQMKNIVEAVK